MVQLISTLDRLLACLLDRVAVRVSVTRESNEDSLQDRFLLNDQGVSRQISGISRLVVIYRKKIIDQRNRYAYQYLATQDYRCSASSCHCWVRDATIPNITVFQSTCRDEQWVKPLTTVYMMRNEYKENVADLWYLARARQLPFAGSYHVPWEAAYAFRLLSRYY